MKQCHVDKCAAYLDFLEFFELPLLLLHEIILIPVADDVRKVVLRRRQAPAPPSHLRLA